MSLNSPLFFVFFIPFVFIYCLAPGRVRRYLILPACLFFYALWDYRSLFFLAFVILITYNAALITGGGSVSLFTKRAVAAIVTIILVFSFFFFRFFDFDNLLIPIGYSFYTLQALGYYYDVFYGRISPEKNLYLYATFVSFFPSVISGPILRAEKFLKTIRSEMISSYDDVRDGLLMMAYGMFAKNFIADRLSYMVDKAYNGWNENTGAVILAGVVLYAFQLYFDFMGYSYIAIGAGRVLGFDMGENFRQPYFSASVKEFWSRWHISLSTWLRDYVYFPLGGSRKGFARCLVNLMIVFIISGFWHGKGYTFLIWGVLHGLYRVAEKIIESLSEKRRSSEKKEDAGKGIHFIRIIRTFILVDLAWLFFRAADVSQAFGMIKRIVTCFGISETFATGAYTFGLSKKILLLYLLEMLIILAVDIMHEKGLVISHRIKRFPLVARWAGYILFVCLALFEYVYYYGYSAVNFIYAGF